MKTSFFKFSKLFAVLAISCLLISSCKKEEPDPGPKKTIVIKGLTIGSSHDTSSDKVLYQGSGGGMVEGEKIEAPGKIKEVIAFLQKQDNKDVKFDFAPFTKRMIGKTSFNAPSHFHPNVPENQALGKYDFYFKIKDELGEESDFVIIKDVEIKGAPVTINKSSVKMSDKKDGAYDTKATIKIGGSAFLAFNDLRTMTPGAKFKGMTTYLYNGEARISIKDEITEGIVGESNVSLSGIELKVPTKIKQKDGTEIDVVPGKYKLYLGFLTDKNEAYSYEFFEVDFVK